MRNFLAKYYPVLLGVIASAISAYPLARYNEPHFQDLKQFLSMMVDVSAISVGFLGAAMSIMLSIGSTNAIRHHRESGTYGKVIDRLSMACKFCFFLTIGSLTLALFENADLKTGLIRRAAVIVWIGLLISSMISCYRAINLMARILRRAANE